MHTWHILSFALRKQRHVSHSLNKLSYLFHFNILPHLFRNGISRTVGTFLTFTSKIKYIYKIVFNHNLLGLVILFYFGGLLLVILSPFSMFSWEFNCFFLIVSYWHYMILSTYLQYYRRRISLLTFRGLPFIYVGVQSYVHTLNLAVVVETEKWDSAHIIYTRLYSTEKWDSAHIIYTRLY